MTEHKMTSSDDILLDLLEYLSTLAVSGDSSPEQKIAAFDAIRELARAWQAEQSGEVQ